MSLKCCLRKAVMRTQDPSHFIIQAFLHTTVFTMLSYLSQLVLWSHWLGSPSQVYGHGTLTQNTLRLYNKRPRHASSTSRWVRDAWEWISQFLVFVLFLTSLQSCYDCTLMSLLLVTCHVCSDFKMQLLMLFLF
jgi:hypothetical protein